MTDALADQLQQVSLSNADESSSSASTAQTATELVEALQRASQSGPKSKRLIRSTPHHVKQQHDGQQEQREDQQQEYTLLSWKTAEFAYRKSAKLSAELPTLARGLFTEQVGEEEHRIVVRGYDKFFNVGELPWTKPEAIKLYSTPPYHLTFKENGCIIFISALSPAQLVVTSKHSLGAREEIEVSHAVMGERWLAKHLSHRGKQHADLAAELWKRNETAVCELCDDSFEEHVIAYTPENSGLHLHGLNRNQPRFATRPMAEVDTFAREWGFIPTRWLEINSMAEVDQLTAEISKTGSWKGEAIEGFVVRTHMPAKPDEETTADGVERGVRPPYEPGQDWFYKIKFDEPYLMYRDWRELTRRLLKEKKDWEASKKDENSQTGKAHVPEKATSQEAEPPAAVTTPETAATASTQAEVDTNKSKKQRKKEAAAVNAEKRRAEAIAAKAATSVDVPDSRPPPPTLRFKRPKTVLYVEWAYDRLYGTPDGRIKPEPALFEHFNHGKGIIALREAYLTYLRTPEGAKRLLELGGSVGADGSSRTQGDGTDVPNGRPHFDKTLIVPIGVPGCGKTSLANALEAIFGWGHTQSDDVQTKRTGPQFLANIERELAKYDVVIADRNNHMFKHRDEIVGMVEKVQKSGLVVPASDTSGAGTDGKKEAKEPAQQTTGQDAKKGKQQKATKKGGATIKIKPRIQLIALTWAFDSHAMNDVHQVCSQRIIGRGDNHQSLRVEGVVQPSNSSRKPKLPHDQVLWSFLEQLEPLGSSLGGEGDEGQADELFHHSIKLEIAYDQEKALRTTISRLAPLLSITQPSESQIQAGLEAARTYKVGVRKEMNSGHTRPKPRYYGISVDTDLEILVDRLTGLCADASLREEARRTFYRLRDNDRLVAYPHITLVHTKSVETEQELAKSSEDEKKARNADGDALGAKKRWDTYQKLCKEHNSYEDSPEHDHEQGKQTEHPLSFSFTVDKLVWNDRVMALGVRDISSAGIRDFAELQGRRGGSHQGRWRPHITVGTARDEIRPFEAVEALRLAEERMENHGDETAGRQGPSAQMIDAGAKGISTFGRLQGMWS